MNQPRANHTRSRTRRRPQQQGRSSDTWTIPAELPEVEPIVIPSDAGVLLRSLGEPPMSGASDAASTFNAVVERAAAVAAALALSADLLGTDDD
jgi:hypothetical protein